jgi:type IV secretion system protein VirB9
MGRNELFAAAALAACLVLPVRADTAGADGRIRAATYDPATVYRLEARVGYEIDVQFEDGESFVGLGAGDLQALTFVAQGKHLFIKPRVPHASTNMTVLTSRRAYHFDYTVVGDEEGSSAMYAFTFVYGPRPDPRPAPPPPPNLDYWYCGHPSLKPVYAADDGVHTRLRFAAHGELPAVFVRNDDGSESLLNFNIEDGDVVVHRVARRFVVRRGALTGCIVNAAYGGPRREHR